MTTQIPAHPVRIPLDTTRILVVEGPEDRTFFTALATHLGIQDDILIVVCGGKNKLAATLGSILTDGNFRNFDHIGIICDNDFPDSRNNRSALEIVQDEIDAANDAIDENVKARRQLPRPLASGVPAGSKPRLTVLLLPAKNRDGMLEDLVLDAIGEDDITNCVDEFFDCLDKTGLAAREARKPRSRLSVYISGKILDTKFATNDDSRRWFLTQAVNMKWWEEEEMWNSPAFNDAKSFLAQLLAS